MKSFNLDTTVTVCGGTPQEPINVSNSNDTYVVDTLVDLELPDITVTDSDGTVATVPSMEDVVCTPSGPSSVRVSNSDDTYDVTTSVDLELPDSSVSNSNNSYVNALPATEDLALPNINFTDSNGVTTSVPSMENIVATSCPVKSGIAYQRPQHTLATISYRTGDDVYNRINNPYPSAPINPTHIAELDLVTDSSGKTLKNNNAFGNLNTWTDINGLQVYANNYAINHLTGLGYDFTLSAASNWNNSIDNSLAHTSFGFSDYRLPNDAEMYSIANKGLSNVLNYTPLNITFSQVWSSTTFRFSTTLAYRSTNAGVFGAQNKTSSSLKHIYVRNHLPNSTAEEVLADGSTMLWVDSEENVTKNGANKVSVWGDKSGEGNDLLQATGASQPLYSTNGILFDGVNDFMKALPFTLVQPEMIYIVFKQITWTLNDRMFDGEASPSMLISQYATSPALNMYGGSSLSNANLALNTFGIARCLYDGANSKFIINDTIPVTGDVGTLSADGFTLAKKPNSTQFYSNIEVKEIIIRKVADSATDEALIYQYLSDKYGI